MKVNTKKLNKMEEVILASKKVNLNCKTISLKRDNNTDEFIPDKFEVIVTINGDLNSKTGKLMKKIIRFAKKSKSRDNILKVFLLANKNNKKLHLSGKAFPRYRDAKNYKID